MSARMSRMLLAAACCCVLLIVIAVGVNVSKKTNRSNRRTTEVQLAVAGTGCDKSGVVTLAMLGQGFKAEEFAMGDQIDWSAPEANSRGAAAFDTSTPTTAQALVDKLVATDEKSVAALNALLFQSGAPREQLLNPGNWVAVQWLIPVDMPGNTAYRDGKSVPAGTRHSKSGDVGWYFVKPDKCQQVENGTAKPHDAVIMVRAGCKNQQTAPVVPARPSGPNPAPKPTTPKPGPAPKPPTPPTPTTCPSTVCKGPATVAPPGEPGSGGSPGNGGAENPGNTGYTPTDPPPAPKVPPAPTPTSIVTLPPTTTPITPITAPPG